MDKDLTLTVLQSLLQTKKAVEALLCAQKNLSLEREDDRLELVKLAKEIHGQRLSAKKARKTNQHQLDTRQQRAVRFTLDSAKLLHTAKTLALCSLPFDRIPDRTPVRKTTLEDGTIVHVKFSSHDSSIDLPYGKDRALISWLMTLSRDQNNPRVEFEGALAFFKAFGLSTGGRSYNEFRASMERICNVIITWGYESESANRDRDVGEKLVYDKNLPQRNDAAAETLGLRKLPGIADSYYIEFGPKTFTELVNRPVSIPLEIMQRYQNNPTAWDFLQFLSSVSSEMNGEDQKAIPINVFARFLGSEDKNTRKLRMKIAKVLDETTDYLSNVRLVGNGGNSVLVIDGPIKVLDVTKKPPSIHCSTTLDNVIN